MKEVVLKELSKQPVGSNTECAYYPCHHDGQDCTFCYCPFYPCNDKEVGGEEIVSRRGRPVWSCKHCHFMHDRGASEYVHQRLSIKDLDDPSGLADLFEETKMKFYVPERERWDELHALSKGTDIRD